MGNLMMSGSLGLDAFEVPPTELSSNYTEDDLQLVIRAVYKQVLGNEHLMESQRLSSAESMLRDGSISVRDFVRAVAQSTLYQDRYFSTCPQYRFIELNFKHFLGRAPKDQAEIQEHVRLYYEQGYEAEINSYLDSAEYGDVFGENIVPYPRAIRSQVGATTEDFNRMFSLLRGSATSDRDKDAKLTTSIAANMATSIEPLAKGTGTYTNTIKQFCVVCSKAGTSATLNRASKRSYVVGYGQLSDTVKNIHRTGGRILEITEL